MKKISIPVLMCAITVMFSCKKNYHCSCEIISNQGNKYNSITTSFKETSRGAYKACEDQAVDSKKYNQSAKCEVVAE